MHTVFALLCFVVVIHWLIFPYPSGLLHWHWQSNDCPSASKATLMNMDKYFMWIHYERWHNHNKAKHNKTVCIFLGIYCRCNNVESFFPYISCFISPFTCILRAAVRVLLYQTTTSFTNPNFTNCLGTSDATNRHAKLHTDIYSFDQSNQTENLYNEHKRGCSTNLMYRLIVSLSVTYLCTKHFTKTHSSNKYKSGWFYSILWKNTLTVRWRIRW